MLLTLPLVQIGTKFLMLTENYGIERAKCVEDSIHKCIYVVTVLPTPLPLYMTMSAHKMPKSPAIAQ